MVVCLGFVIGKGMSEVLYYQFKFFWIKYFLVLLVVGVIGIGNVVYEFGNFIGVVLGLNNIVVLGIGFWGGIMGGFVVILLWCGKYQFIENVLVVLVVIMVLVFVVIFVVFEFDWLGMFS